MTIALLLAVLPLGKGLLIHNLAYSTWSLLFLLIVLLAYPLPSSGITLALRSTAVILCIISHPLSLIALPLCLIHLALEKGSPQRLCVALFMATILVHQTLGVEYTSASISISKILGSAVLTAKLFLSRVLLETVSGAPASTMLLSFSPRSTYFLGTAVLSVQVFLAVTASASSKAKWAIAIGLLLASGIIFVSVAGTLESKRAAYFRLASGSSAPAEIYNPHLQRYFYVSKLIFMILLLSQVIPRLRRAIFRLQPMAIGLVLIGAVSYILALNGYSNYLYTSSLAEGERVAAFLSDVQANVRRAEAGLPYTSEWVLPRGGAWDVRLSIDSHLRRN
jgi:hypothetical protein